MKSEVGVKHFLVLPLIHGCSLVAPDIDLLWKVKETPPGSQNQVSISTSGERRRGRSDYRPEPEPQTTGSALFHRRSQSLEPARRWESSRSKDSSNAMGKDAEREPRQQKMSLGELPPIIPRPGTGSGKSRQSSSAGNSATAGNVATTQTSRGQSVKYSGRPSLISAEDSGIVINGSESGRFTGTGRSPILSPGSGSGSDSGGEDVRAFSFNGTNNSMSENFGSTMRSRATTWGADSQRPKRSESVSKLHPLYEQKGSSYGPQVSVSNSSENAKNTDDLKLPTTMGGGHSSHKSNYNSFGKRTQSFSNLSSKYSETDDNNTTVPNRNISPAKNNNTNSTNLHKVRSDQNIYYTGRAFMTSQSGRKTRMSNVSGQSFKRSSGMLHSKSQPNIPQTMSPTKANINRASTSKKKYSIENDGKISESLVRYDANSIFGEVNEKDKRIIDWLREIETEAERPESPEIIVDEPQQTDTAIHVIYGED